MGSGSPGNGDLQKVRSLATVYSKATQAVPAPVGGGIQCILEIQAQTQGRTLELSRFCQQPGGGGGGFPIP